MWPGAVGNLELTTHQIWHIYVSPPVWEILFSYYHPVRSMHHADHNAVCNSYLVYLVFFFEPTLTKIRQRKCPTFPDDGVVGRSNNGKGGIITPISDRRQLIPGFCFSFERSSNLKIILKIIIDTSHMHNWSLFKLDYDYQFENTINLTSLSWYQFVRSRSG